MPREGHTVRMCDAPHTSTSTLALAHTYLHIRIHTQRYARIYVGV